MMRYFFLTCFMWLSWCSGEISAEAVGPIQLTLDTSEAEQALRIIHKEAGHEAVTSEDWQHLFETPPYRWLKAREAAMGRAFTDKEFKTFLLSPAALTREQELEEVLGEMKSADMQALATSVLAWLPAGATIHARVFPEIKPKTNSFVWTKEGDGPAIFLYLERQNKAQFENTVLHECHHIGLDSLQKQQEEILVKLPENVRRATHWIGGFGEGEAMLAAAGSVERHPHWEDKAAARARWDSDMMHFNSDLLGVQQLLNDILDGKLKDDAAISKRASAFWGAQGAWYTVGYEMAALVELQYGREAFKQCLLDPRKLLQLYNEIAAKANVEGASLATWSPELLTRLESPK